MTSSVPRLVAGTTLIVTILAGSRWITHVGVPPLYLSDALLYFCVLIALYRALRTRRGDFHTDGRPKPALTPNSIVLVLAFYATLRAVLSVPVVERSQLIPLVRDFAPFAYCLVAYLAAYGLSSIRWKAKRRTFLAIYTALLLHLGWVAFAVLSGHEDGIELGLIFDVNPFKIRHDFDGLLIAILLGLSVRALVIGHRWLLNLTVSVISVVIISLMFSRAALIATVIALAIGLWLGFKHPFATQRKRTAIVAILPIATIASLGALLGLTTPGQRLLASIAPTTADTAAEVNALGTMGARWQAWTDILHWSTDSFTRLVFGSGFGNNFLAQSESLDLLQGTVYEGVRSPHNYLVGVLARLGVVGVVIVVALLIITFYWCVRRQRLLSSDPLLAFSCLTVATILATSLVGVVLESPFGAIPFFWCVGLLTARHRHGGRGPRAAAAAN